MALAREFNAHKFDDESDTTSVMFTLKRYTGENETVRSVRFVLTVFEREALARFLASDNHDDEFTLSY